MNALSDLELAEVRGYAPIRPVRHADAGDGDAGAPRLSAYERCLRTTTRHQRIVLAALTAQEQPVAAIAERARLDAVTTGNVLRWLRSKGAASEGATGWLRRDR